MTSAEVGALTDEQLDDLILQALGRCRAPQRRYAELVSAGTAATEAVRVAYGSRKRTSPNQPMKSPAVARAVELLREKHSRTAGTTAREIRLFWVKLRDEAFENGKYDAASRANEMLAKLAGMFPEQQLKISVSHPIDLGSVTEEEMRALAMLTHRQLAANSVIDATAVEVAPQVKSEEDLSDVLC